MNEGVSEYLAKQLFDPDMVKADGEKTIAEMEKTQHQLKVKLAQAQLDLQEIDKNGAKSRADDRKKAADEAADKQEEADKAEEKRRQDLVAQQDKDYEEAIQKNREQAKSRIAIMIDEKEKQKQLLIQANEEYMQDFLLKRIDDEKKALDEQFISRQISEKDYNKNYKH